MAEETPPPVFQIQPIYLKALSLEQPNSPQNLPQQAQPQLDIDLSSGAKPLGHGIVDVAATATATPPALARRADGRC